MLFDNFDPTLEYDCSPYVKSTGFTKLMYIIINIKDDPALRNDIKNYVDIIDVQNDQGWIAFMIACRNCSSSGFETVKMLYDLGANIHLPNNKGSTAFMSACVDNAIDVMNLLLPHINVNLQNNNGETSLILLGIHDCKIEVFQFLLDVGADVHITNKNGYTSLVGVCESTTNNTINIIKLLLNAGVNINARCCYKTALVSAFLHNSIDVVKLLLDNGAKFTPNDLGLCSDRDKRMLLLSYCNIAELEEIIKNKVYITDVLEALSKLYKIERIKIRNYERILRLIPEQDSKIRFKPNNMGYKICQYDYDGIVTKELLDYLSATPDTITEKVKEYLAFTCC